MKNLPVDLSELQIALESHDGGLGLHTYWFDTETGEVIFLTEDLEEQDELRQQIEEGTDNRFVQIEPLPSHDGFRIMENFVQTLPRSRIREKLEWSLGGPKPFRRFKDAVRENRAVLEKWYKFHDAALAHYAVEWLAELSIQSISGPATKLDIDAATGGAEENVAAEIEGGVAADPPRESSALILPAIKHDTEASLKTGEARGQTAEAGLEFVCRELRLHHPDGTFDEGGRFYPSEKEARDCCATIRAPSRAFPFSLMKHCRTIKHVAKLYDVTERAVKAEAEIVRQQLWYLCYVRDFDRIRTTIESSTFTVDPFLAPPHGMQPRAILEEARTHGILKRAVWDHLFASLDDYEKRWRANSNPKSLAHTV
jgi:Uncharacterised protein family (UPF0158)